MVFQEYEIRGWEKRNRNRRKTEIRGHELSETLSYTLARRQKCSAKRYDQRIHYQRGLPACTRLSKAGPDRKQADQRITRCGSDGGFQSGIITRPGEADGFFLRDGKQF